MNGIRSRSTTVSRSRSAYTCSEGFEHAHALCAQGAVFSISQRQPCPMREIVRTQQRRGVTAGGGTFPRGRDAAWEIATEEASARQIGGDCGKRPLVGRRWRCVQRRRRCVQRRQRAIDAPCPYHACVALWPARPGVFVVGGANAVHGKDQAGAPPPHSRTPSRRSLETKTRACTPRPHTTRD